MRQLKLFENVIPKSFGGESLKGKRKSARPLSTKHPLHLILKSREALQKGGFFRQKNRIQNQMEAIAKKWGIQIFERYIGGNHIHLAIQTPSREAYVKFITTLSGALAKFLKINFDHRPFSRIVTWGRDFSHLKQYIRRNFFEAIGLISYRPRGQNEKKWRLKNAPPTAEDWAEAFARPCAPECG